MEEDTSERRPTAPRRSGGGPSSDRQGTGGPSRPRGPVRRFERRPRLCQFCAEKVRAIDYKQTDLLRRFVNEQGKIRPRRETGVCSKHQRVLAKAVKQARHMALLPYASDRFR